MEIRNNNNKTPQQVAAAIKEDFRAQNLTIKEAAARMGMSNVCLSSALSRGTYIGRVTASRLSSTFGYDLSFLYTGAGMLRKADTAGTAEGSPSAVDIQLRQLISICVGISASVADLQRRFSELSARLATIERRE